MWLCLIPVGYGRDVRFQVVVRTIGFPSKVLYRYFQVFIEAYGVGDVPTIHTEALSIVVRMASHESTYDSWHSTAGQDYPYSC